jgi:hypothetical protein
MEPVKKDLAICGSFFGPKKACPDLFIFFRDPEIRESDFSGIQKCMGMSSKEQFVIANLMPKKGLQNNYMPNTTKQFGKEFYSNQPISSPANGQCVTCFAHDFEDTMVSNGLPWSTFG